MWLSLKAFWMLAKIYLFIMMKCKTSENSTTTHSSYKSHLSSLTARRIWRAVCFVCINNGNITD